MSSHETTTIITITSLSAANAAEAASTMLRGLTASQRYLYRAECPDLALNHAHFPDLNPSK